MFSGPMLDALTQVLMAALGALARVLNKQTALKISHTLKELFIAAFMGLMLFGASSSLDLADGWLFVASGVAGWLGPSVMDWLSDLTTKKLGMPKVDKPPGGTESSVSSDSKED